MIANAETCIKALRALAQDIQSEDGVANAALHECADRMEQLENDVNRLATANLQLREGIETLKQRIHRLEKAGDRMINEGWNEPHLAAEWRKAKEAKP